MVWRLGRIFPVLYACVIGVGLAGGVALASGPMCPTCTVTNVSGCAPTGSFETVNCCMPVNGGAKDCFTCQREQYLCGGTTAYGAPFNCADQGVACSGN